MSAAPRMEGGQQTGSGTIAYPHSRNDDSHRGILWGLAASVLFHLLLILFSRAVPIGGAEPVAALAEETPITFRFANPVEDPTTDDPLQDSPFLPVEPQPDSAPSQPVPFTPPTAPPGSAGEGSQFIEEFGSSEEETSVDRPFPEPDPPQEAPAVERDLFEKEQGPQPTEPRPTVTPERRRLDIEQAVREFGEQLRERPVVVRPKSGASGKPSNVYTPQFDQLPTTGFGVGNLTFESADFDWEDYGRQIYQAIWRAWHNRLYVTVDDFEKWSSQSRIRALNHRTGLRFVIESSGDVSEIRIELESGCLPFDSSASDALAEVILPPLPPGFPRDREVVHATFLGQGPVIGLRPNLRAMRRAGYF